MGLRDWFKSGSSDKKTEDDEASALEDERRQKAAFAELQDAKTVEALSLFDEEETPQRPEEAGKREREDHQPKRRARVRKHERHLVGRIMASARPAVVDRV